MCGRARTRTADSLGLLNQITEPLRPATTNWQARQDSNPDPTRLELAMLAVTPRACEERKTRIERVSPGWRPGALPPELHPHLRAFEESLRQESNPHLGRTKGACLPLTLRRHRAAPAGLEPALPRVRTGSSAV